MEEWAFLLESTLQSWRAAGKPRRIMAAVSGGADSVALLLALHALAGQEDILLSAAHVDHGLRASSGDDAAFVSALCQSLRVPCLIRKAEIQGCSENAAREARYAALFSCCMEADASCLALAHHRQDQMETVLLHLFRGSGSHGLSGMSPLQERKLPDGKSLFCWRPFLSLPSDMLRRILQEKGISWREDETNAQDFYLRNYMRHQVIPAIARRIPKAEEAVSRAAGILREEADFFQGAAMDFLKSHACLQLPCPFLLWAPFSRQHPALQRHILRLAIPCDMDFEKIQQLLGIARGESLNLGQGWRAMRTESRLHFLPPVPSAVPLVPCRLLPRSGHETGDGRRIQALPKALYDQCTLRYRLPGDQIHPFGAKGHKSLQDYLVDRKIDRPFRDYLPLLCIGRQVIWVIGVGPGEEARIASADEVCLVQYDGYLPGEMPR